MIVLVFRILFGILAIVFITSQVVYPMLVRDVPFFWIFKLRKYKNEIKTVEKIAYEQDVAAELTTKINEINKNQ